jgi:CubicO group peptidase (beta-lactamase class C family)
LAGAVAIVADARRVLSLDTVGWADLGKRRPMQPDSMFWIASQTKPVTGTAVMMLVDAGKLSLDDPVERYIPEFKDLWVADERDAEHVVLRRPRRAITVRDLLCHTSGLPFCSLVERPTLDLLPLRVAVLTYAATPLDFQPGTKNQYSNAGINTAGRIVELVSGMAIQDFLADRIFAPLGMVDTTFVPSASQVRRLARSYKPTAGADGMEEAGLPQLKHPLTDRIRQPMPAGGLFSTADDMLRFSQMVANRGRCGRRQLLSEQAVATMIASQDYPELEPAARWGLGWWTDGVRYGHGGAHATNHEIDRETGLITIFMVQHAGFPGNGKDAHAAYKAAGKARFAKR